MKRLQDIILEDFKLNKKGNISSLHSKYDSYIEETVAAILEIIKNDNTISITNEFKKWIRAQVYDWMDLSSDETDLSGIVLYCYSESFHKKITSYLDKGFLWGKELKILTNEYCANDEQAFGSGKLKNYEDTYNNINIKYNIPFFRISLKCGNIYFMKNVILC